LQYWVKLIRRLFLLGSLQQRF